MKIKVLVTTLCSLLLLTSVYAASIEVEGTETGNTLIFSVSVDDVTDFDTTDFTINYDSSVLELVSVEPGTVSKGGNANLNKENNKVLLNMPGVKGVSGSGTIVEINFNVIGTGDKSITLSNFNMGDRFGIPIEASVTYVGKFASSKGASGNNSILIYSLIAVGAIILIVGGFVAWNKFKKPKDELPIHETTPLQQTDQPQPTQPAPQQPQPAPDQPPTDQQPDQPTQ